MNGTKAWKYNPTKTRTRPILHFQLPRFGIPSLGFLIPPPFCSATFHVFGGLHFHSPPQFLFFPIMTELLCRAANLLVRVVAWNVAMVTYGLFFLPHLPGCIIPIPCNNSHSPSPAVVGFMEMATTTLLCGFRPARVHSPGVVRNVPRQAG